MSDPPSRPVLASEPTPAALRIRITAGILYAACRFVPVPLLDDLLREQITAWMVRSTVPTSIPKSAIAPLWSSQTGCLGGCLGSLVELPIKLLLFPLRKVIAIVLGVRWVSRDLAEMLLLGRVLDHAVAVGLVDGTLDPGEQLERSRDVRTAFDVALAGTDTRFLSALIGTALGPVRGVVAAAMRTLRRQRRTHADAPHPEGADRAVIEGSVSRVESLLGQPEVKRFLAEFDTRVLENIEELARRRAARRA